MIRMKQERLRRGWNQTTLGFHAGLSTSDISRIESGRLQPYPSQIERLETALGLAASELLQTENDERR